jgi:hypothetical protein
MKMKLGIAAVLIVAFVLGIMGTNSLSAQDKGKAQSQQKVFIPKQVKTVLQEGLLTRQGRQDIPFTFERYLYLPARDNLHNIIFFKVKNADLGFAPAAETPAAPAAPDQTQAASAPQLEAKFNAFLWFSTLAEDGMLQTIKEVYIPAVIQTPAEGYDPEKVESYSFGYPLPAGHYLLAMALTSQDLSKIGTGYYEFTAPAPSAPGGPLDTTPIFFVQSYEQMQAPEMRTEIHKNCFTYSILKLEPKAANAFNVGENLDIFFIIFGLKPNDQQKYNVLITYEVRKGDETAIKYEDQPYDSPLISQPLPLKQTVIIKSDKGESQEERDLQAGLYTLVIKITDKVTGSTAEKKVDFEVKSSTPRP